MRSAVLATPRPVPNRVWPAVAGAALILVALPLFLLAGWPFEGWLLAAGLYAAGEAILFVLSRLPLGADHLASSGIAAIGMTTRVIGVMLVLIAVAVASKPIGISAALLYICSYSLELSLSLVLYFTGPTR